MAALQVNFLHRRFSCTNRICIHSYSTTPFKANDKTYNPPANPVAVICIDGCEDTYLETSLNRNRMPNLAKLLQSGAFRWMCKGALPSFTNVNNAGIISGTPPYKHGISGNFFVNEKNEEVMMNSNKYLECENILEKAQEAGRKVSIVTAKDKLRDLLGGDNITKSTANPAGIAISTEFLKKATKEQNGIEYDFIMDRLMKTDKQFRKSYIDNTFSVYSGESSINVLKLGVKLIENGLTDFAYLSTSDYIQHKHSPSEPEALDFYAAIDEEIGGLIDLGCTIGITADHGMNDKTLIIYLQQILNEHFSDYNDINFNGKERRIKVICPITDPYVVHHGSLGSFVYIYINNEDNFFESTSDLEDYRQEIMDFIDGLDEIEQVYCKDSTTVVLQLPYDRIGDIAVVGKKNVAIGKTPNDHELEHISSGLRTHGGRTEEMVPFIVSKGLNKKYSELITKRELRNFNIFEFTCNGTQ